VAGKRLPDGAVGFAAEFGNPLGAGFVPGNPAVGGYDGAPGLIAPGAGFTAVGAAGLGNPPGAPGNAGLAAGAAPGNAGLAAGANPGVILPVFGPNPEAAGVVEPGNPPGAPAIPPGAAIPG